MDVSSRRRGHEFNFHLFLKHDFGRMAGSRRRRFHVSLQVHRDTRSSGAGVERPPGHVVHVLLAVQAEHLLEVMNVHGSLAPIESIHLPRRKNSRSRRHGLI